MFCSIFGKTSLILIKPGTSFCGKLLSIRCVLTFIRISQVLQKLLQNHFTLYSTKHDFQISQVSEVRNITTLCWQMSSGCEYR